MTETVGGFCRDLLEEHEQGVRLDPETIAARFVEHFNVSSRPDLDELTDLARRAGFGEVLEGKMDGLKGAPHRTARGRVPHLLPGRSVGGIKGPDRGARNLRDHP